jgi:hypothetical protein
MKIVLADFNGKVDIFKPTIVYESLHKISNDNGVRVENFILNFIEYPLKVKSI